MTESNKSLMPTFNIENLSITLGDYREASLILGNASVDMILMDPPFGTTDAVWDTMIDLEDMWRILGRVCKPGAMVLIHATQPFTTHLIGSKLDWFKYDWVWRKSRVTNFLNAKKQPMREHESITVFNKPPRGTYNPQGLVAKQSLTRQGLSGRALYDHGAFGREYIQSNTNYPRSVLEFRSEGKLHPTQKPVALLEYLIRTYTNEGELVVDFTMGSGSTGVASQNTGRRFWGCDIDPHFFSVAHERLLDATR